MHHSRGDIGAICGSSNGKRPSFTGEWRRKLQTHRRYELALPFIGDLADLLRRSPALAITAAGAIGCPLDEIALEFVSLMVRTALVGVSYRIL
jgi:hypothetical protein